METPHRQPPSSTLGFNLNIHSHHHEQPELSPPPPPSQQFAKEHMFEKPLTPSDVGKLNRLVIPKQHAEKYFPMADQQKSVVLCFEDESGKMWRFRYSYWSSSQSYVLTKGWSRYVKEKGLDAGDIVMFERHVVDGQRMFIGSRQRFVVIRDQQEVIGPESGGRSVSGGGVPFDYSSNHHHHLTIAPPHPEFLNSVEIYENMDTCQRGDVATRRVRLFGVNLECHDNSEPSDLHKSSHDGQSHHQYDIDSNTVHHNTMRYHHHEG